MKKNQAASLDFVYALAVIILLFSLSCNKSVRQLDTKKPNIIFILADDLGYGEVGFNGQTKIETPNIDKLAREGIILNNFYTSAPVCAPARASFLTGLHLGHCPVRGNDEWSSRGDVWNYKKIVNDQSLEGQRPLPTNQTIFPQLLKQQGYTCGMIGKWGLGAPDSESIPTKMGFDYFFGYNCQRQAHTYFPNHLYENEKRYQLNNEVIPPSVGLLQGQDSLSEGSYHRFFQKEYSEEISFDKLMSFVDQNKSRPFFLYWASPIPHLPLQAPLKWVDYYSKKFGKEKPYYYYGEKGSYYPCYKPKATYAAMVSYLDENIGKLVQYLKDNKLYENTLIVFTSDNGPSYTGGTDSPWFNSGGSFESTYGKGKGFLQEGGIRVPFFATWPKHISSNSKSNENAALWDLFPTFMDITGGKNNNLDGQSLLPLITGKSKKINRAYLYWEFPEYGGQIAVRKGDYKILWKDIKKGNKEIEVYNLKNDPKELQNLSKDNKALIDEFYSIIKNEHTTPEITTFRIEEVESLIKTGSSKND